MELNTYGKWMSYEQNKTKELHSISTAVATCNNFCDDDDHDYDDHDHDDNDDNNKIMNIEQVFVWHTISRVHSVDHTYYVHTPKLDIGFLFSVSVFWSV